MTHQDLENAAAQRDDHRHMLEQKQKEAAAKKAEAARKQAQYERDEEALFDNMPV